MKEIIKYDPAADEFEITIEAETPEEQVALKDALIEMFSGE